MSDKLTRMRAGEGLEQSLTDWAWLDGLTDEEIAEAFRNDPDSFEPDPGQLEHALVVRATRPKQRLTLRLDADLVDWFRAQGAGYQARINAVLRAYVERARAGWGGPVPSAAAAGQPEGAGVEPFSRGLNRS